MKVIDGKIVQLTYTELQCLYFDRDMDEVMSFDTYKQGFINAGCIITSDDIINILYKHKKIKASLKKRQKPVSRQFSAHQFAAAGS